MNLGVFFTRGHPSSGPQKSLEFLLRKVLGEALDGGSHISAHLGKQQAQSAFQLDSGKTVFIVPVRVLAQFNLPFFRSSEHSFLLSWSNGRWKLLGTFEEADFGVTNAPFCQLRRKGRWAISAKVGVSRPGEPSKNFGYSGISQDSPFVQSSPSHCDSGRGGLWTAEQFNSYYSIKINNIKMSRSSHTN